MTDRDLNAIAMFFVASALVVYFSVLIQACVSIFRDRNTGGLKKAAWLVFLLVVPVVAPIVYVLTRRARAARPAEDGSAALVQSEILVHIRPSSHRSMLEQMRGAKELLDSGVIDRSEFLEMKAQAFRARLRDVRDLASPPAPVSDPA